MRGTNIAVLAVVMLIAGTVQANESRLNTKAVPKSAPRASLVPRVVGQPIVLLSLRKLAVRKDRLGIRGLFGSMTRVKGAFAGETNALANDGRSAQAVASPASVRTSTGLTDSLRDGMAYQLGSQSLYPLSGSEPRETVGEWKNEAMLASGVAAQRWNNADKDLVRPPTEPSWSRMAVSWNKPAWPYVAFSVAQNAARYTMDPLNLFPQRASHHNVEAAVGYSGEIWDAKFTSRYGLETDLLNHGAESQVQTQTVTASLRPIHALTITPTIGYRAEHPESSAARIDSPSASLVLNYKQTPRLSITAMGNYFALRSTDKLIDLDNLGGKGIVTWELNALEDWKPQLSVEGGYNLQVNRLMPSAQTENISGLIRLVLATM